MAADAEKEQQDMTAAENKELKIGRFYWIIPAFDPDTNNEWENEPQPARYEGDDKWTVLGIDGISEWPVRWVGDEITI